MWTRTRKTRRQASRRGYGGKALDDGHVFRGDSLEMLAIIHHDDHVLQEPEQTEGR